MIIVALALGKMDSHFEGGSSKKISLKQGLPWFVVGFIILVAINSMISIPPQIKGYGNGIASMLLLFAVIAAAIKSDTAGLLAHGWRSFGPVIFTTLTSFGLSLLAATLL